MIMNILDFGNEDKSYISNNDLKKILISHFRGITKLIKYIHFNNNHISNNNIRYFNNNIEIIENGIFRIMNKEYILETLILESWMVLYNFYENMNTSQLIIFKDSLISEETFIRIEEFINVYQKICDGEIIYLEDIKLDIFNMIKYETNKLKNN